MLDDKVFWSRVKMLENKSVRLLGTNQIRLIDLVDVNYIKVRDRVSKIYFTGKWGLYENYHVLYRDGWVQPGDNISARSLSMSIILGAVPDEVSQDGVGLTLIHRRA